MQAGMDYWKKNRANMRRDEEGEAMQHKEKKSESTTKYDEDKRG